MKKFICTVCGYIYEDEKAPRSCPICNTQGSKFYQDIEDVDYLKRNVIGIAQDIDEDIIEELRNNFIDECIEVGMYLAMSHKAMEDGYPKVSRTYEEISKKEAEHAASFAELLGELVVADTKENLILTISKKLESIESKIKLAERAKELELYEIYSIIDKINKQELKYQETFVKLLNKMP